ncbi:MAG: TonB-dependent receptor [Ignavibacteriales bacterium]|nr:TonB-dependent receptor [Ignavibacteriales bacterium]
MTAYYSFLGLILQGLLVNFLFAITPAEGQNLRDVKVSVNVVNVSLEEALQIIESKTNFKFIFFEEGLPLKEKATVIVDEESLYNLLEVFAKDYGLTFNRINDQIVVRKNQGQTENLVSATESGTIKGKVTDAKTGEGLVGASVAIKGTNRGASTDLTGNYTIDNINAGKYTLVVSCVGFKSKEATVNVVTNETTGLNFQLDATEINMNEVVITTSTVLPTAVKKLPNTISIITPREIENINPPNVVDLIRLTVPGAVYTVEGPGKTYGSFSVRGVSSFSGSASTMKVYIDGVEASDPAYITYLDPSVIDHVEVVPGPQASTIYGAGAISGVMQIFTKHGIVGDLKLSGKVGMTSIDNKYIGNNTAIGNELALNGSGGISFMTYNVGVNYQNEPKWLNQFEQSSLNLTGSGNFNVGNFSGTLSLNYSKTDGLNSENPLYKQLCTSIGIPYSMDYFENSIYKTYGLTLSYKLNENWSHNLTLGYNTLNGFVGDRVASTSNNRYYILESRTERYTTSYNTSYQTKIGENTDGSITLGADWTQYAHPFYEDSVANRTNYNFVDQNTGYVINKGFYGQALVSVNNFLFFTGGLRADKNPSGADNSYTWSPRLGLSGVYEVEKWMVKGRVAWGQSVNIPDASEVTGMVASTYTILPNAGLLSEIQKGWEIGADLYYSSILSLGLTYFNQHPTNLIESVLMGTDVQGNPIYQYQNVAEVKNEGFEIKAVTHPFDWLTLNLNYGTTKSTVTQLRPEYTGTSKVGDQLTGQPQHTLSLNLEIIPFEGTSVTISAFQFGEWIGSDFYGYFADMYSGNYNPVIKEYPSGYLMTYPSYLKINFGVSQKITNQLSGYIQVTNLTNTDKFERINLIVTQPRTVLFGFRFSGITL